MLSDESLCTHDKPDLRRVAALACCRCMLCSEKGRIEIGRLAGALRDEPPNVDAIECSLVDALERGRYEQAAAPHR